MPRLVRALPLAALALLPRLARGQERPPAPEPVPEIETVGTGERRVAPDRATVLLTIESKAPAAAAAASANARAVVAVRDTLRSLRVDSAVVNASYNVGPDYAPPRPVDREGPRQVGYVARTVLRVPLGRIDQIGRVIDAGLARGATGVQGVLFESSLADAARRDALADAAAAARRDAEVLARALGGTVGALLGVSTAPTDRRPLAAARVAGGYAGYAPGTEVTPSEIVVTAAVATRWRFVPGAR